MAEGLGALEFVIKGDASGAISALAETAGIAGAAMIAFDKLKEIIVEAVKASAEEEEALAGLASAMYNMGTATQESFNDLAEYAEALKGQSKFSDEAIMASEALLMRFGAQGDQLKELTKATLDFATATGMDLNAATRLVAKTINEDGGNALKRWGIEVEAGSTSTERMDNVIKSLSAHFEGAAAKSIDTFNGKMKLAKDAQDDIYKSIGNQLLPVLKDYADDLIKIAKNSELMDGLARTTGVVIFAFRELLSVWLRGFDIFKDMLDTMAAPFRLIKDEIDILTVGLNKFATDTIGRISDSIKSLMDNVTPIITEIKTKVQEVIDKIKIIIDAVREKIDDVIIALMRLAAPVIKVFSEIFDKIAEAIAPIINKFKSIVESFEIMVSNLSASDKLKAMAKAFTDTSDKIVSTWKENGKGLIEDFEKNMDDLQSTLKKGAATEYEITESKNKKLLANTKETASMEFYAWKEFWSMLASYSKEIFSAAMGAIQKIADETFKAINKNITDNEKKQLDALEKLKGENNIYYKELEALRLSDSEDAYNAIRKEMDAAIEAGDGMLAAKKKRQLDEIDLEKAANAEKAKIDAELLVAQTKIKHDAWEQKKVADIIQSGVSYAQAILTDFAVGGPLGLVLAGATTLATAGAIATIASQTNPYADGGIIDEPIHGMGASGKRYSFGENGAERISPVNTTNNSGHTISIGNITVGSKADATAFIFELERRTGARILRR